MWKFNLIFFMVDFVDCLVSFRVETFEEYEKHDRLDEEEPRKEGRKITLDEKQLHAVETNEKKLYHLENGQVFLPPQIFLKLRTHRRH
jgi:hypothetical protein